MSFVTQRLVLPNSLAKDHIDVHQFKLCNKCDTKKPPEGGVQMTREKWYCAKCWTTRATTHRKAS